jgi:hypothetical protein
MSVPFHVRLAELQFVGVLHTSKLLTRIRFIWRTAFEQPLDRIAPSVSESVSLERKRQESTSR